MIKKILLSIIITVTIVWTAYSLQLFHTTPVLMYHNVGTKHQNSMYVTPENFEKQMRYLHTKNYTVIPLDAYVAAISENKKIPRKTVVITFDDGYEDNFTYAFPILKKYDFPATITLVTNNMGRSVDDEMYLSWDQIALMAENNISFGAHTHNHVYLPSTEPSLAKEEIETSKRIIEEHLKTPVTIFAYPIGAFTPETKELVKHAGFTAALSTKRGLQPHTDLFEIKRIKISNRDGIQLIRFAGKLSGYYTLFKRPQPGY